MWPIGEYSQLRGLDVLGRALDGVAVLCGELGDELQQGGALVLHRLPVAAEQGLVLSRQDVDPRLQLREAVPDVVHQQPGVRGGKRRELNTPCCGGGSTPKCNNGPLFFVLITILVPVNDRN